MILEKHLGGLFRIGTLPTVGKDEHQSVIGDLVLGILLSQGQKPAREFLRLLVVGRNDLFTFCISLGFPVGLGDLGLGLGDLLGQRLVFFRRRLLAGFLVLLVFILGLVIGQEGWPKDQQGHNP